MTVIPPIQQELHFKVRKKLESSIGSLILIWSDRISNSGDVVDFDPELRHDEIQLLCIVTGMRSSPDRPINPKPL